MHTSHLAQDAVSTGNPILNISIFIAFIVVTMTIVVRATRKTSQKGSDFCTGGADFNGMQNGLAISGDYLSTAAFLGVTGAIALYGYDGFLYSVGFLFALLVALVLVAEPLRNTGRFTMADVLSFRLKQRPVRTAAAISTLCITLFYLIAQMAGAGGLVALLLCIAGRTAQSLVVGIVSVLMIVYVLVGGMKGTTYVQMIKAVLLVGGSLIICALTFIAIRGGFNELLVAATQSHPAGKEILGPGMKYGASTLTKLDFVSLGMALVFGTAGLPHVLMRFYTVPTAREAHRVRRTLLSSCSLPRLAAVSSWRLSPPSHSPPSSQSLLASPLQPPPPSPTISTTTSCATAKLQRRNRCASPAQPMSSLASSPSSWASGQWVRTSPSW